MKRVSPSATRPSTSDLLALEPSAVMRMLERGAITRRDVFKVMSAAGVASLGMRLFNENALAADELKIIIWEGYADDAYRIPFEEANDAIVSYTERGYGRRDVCPDARPATARTTTWFRHRPTCPSAFLTRACSLKSTRSKLTNYNDLWDQFKSPDYITFDEKLYGVNFAWGPTLMMQQLGGEMTTAPTSVAMRLMDEQYSAARSRPGTTRFRSPNTRYFLILFRKMSYVLS